MIDLHIHTTYSDGRKTVKELLCEAEKLGLKLYQLLIMILVVLMMNYKMLI